MAWIEFNNNPVAARVGDCAVRAVSKALDVDWETAYIMLVANGMAMGDVISSDNVWGATLRQHGFYRRIMPDSCPDCYTVEDFCADHPVGTFTLGLGGHVVTAQDGDWFDTWDSGQEPIQFIWYRKEA